MVRLVGAEILEYNSLKREMINARIKYEDRVSKMNNEGSGALMPAEVVNEEVRKHIEIYNRAVLEKNREFLYRGVSNRNAPKLMNVAKN